MSPMFLDTFLSDGELDSLASEVAHLESMIDDSSDDHNLNARIQRLDEIIRVITASQENICRNNPVVRLF